MKPTPRRRAKKEKVLVSSTQTSDVEDYAAEDRPLLSLIALWAAQSAVARSPEVILEAALTQAAAPTAPCASLHASDDSSNAERPLQDRYPEVRILLHLHCIRRALRDLQGCAFPIRRGLYAVVQEHLTHLAEVLPDPLFMAIASVLQGWLKDERGGAFASESCHVLEVQILHIVEATQIEVLRATKHLRVRADNVALRFHHDIPYL